MIDNLFNLSNFDRKLSTGMAVEASWCQGGFFYSGKATIVKLHHESVVVKLQSVVGAEEAYFIGKTIELPRFKDQTRWSPRNCILPLDKKVLRRPS